jgi:hypothetical protein
MWKGGSGGKGPRILDLGVRWRSIISVMLRPFYPREGAPLPQSMEAKILYIKALALEGDEWSASWSSSFPAPENTPIIRYRGSSVGPQSGYALGKEEIWERSER